MPTLDQRYESAIQCGDLNLGMELAIEQAKSQGYSIQAYHGTYSTFDEFKEGDIGFHFSKDRRIAEQRLDDTYLEHIDFKTKIEPEGRVLSVILKLTKPLVIWCDFSNWTAQCLFKCARMKVTGKPMYPQSEMFLYEQNLLAKEAHRVLKIAGYDTSSILLLSEQLNEESSTELNKRITQDIRNSLRQSKYDGIYYKNEYETYSEFDPTSYIVFTPNQIKSIEPIYERPGILRRLSDRFDSTSPKYVK